MRICMVLGILLALVSGNSHGFSANGLVVSQHLGVREPPRRCFQPDKRRTIVKKRLVSTLPLLMRPTDNSDDSTKVTKKQTSNASITDSLFKKQQRFVKTCIVLGIPVVGACFAVAISASRRLSPVDNATQASLELAMKSMLGPALCMGAQILAAANHRLNSAEDIEGSAVNPQGSKRQQQLQAALQNTLEQTCYAMPVYMAAAVVFPQWRLVVPTASLLFVLGRFLFFLDLQKGVSVGRALGFALTFQPTNVLLVATISAMFLGFA